MATLKELMALQEPTPRQIELQAKYMNAQIAVDLSHRLVKDLWPEAKLNPEYVPGKDLPVYLTSTSDDVVVERIRLARILKLEIEKDLNDTLKVLEVVADGAKADAPKLS